MMKKAERMEDFVGRLVGGDDSRYHACYRGYFVCFNAGRYYEAHDVLEHLWLQEGKRETFYKGLIQVAGGFVHLQKHYLRPFHHKDGRRLAPAARLFRLAVKNMEAYRPRYQGLDVEALCALCGRLAEGIEAGKGNPWRPEMAPQLRLDL